jgi:hypothetical protein
VSEVHATVALGDVPMRWRVEFYHERRAVIARYVVVAPMPGAAAAARRDALFAEFPPMPARRRMGLFERAQRVGGLEASGWVLYRIVKD